MRTRVLQGDKYRGRLFHEVILRTDKRIHFSAMWDGHYRKELLRDSLIVDQETESSSKSLKSTARPYTNDPYKEGVFEVSERGGAYQEGGEGKEGVNGRCRSGLLAVEGTT